MISHSNDGCNQMYCTYIIQAALATVFFLIYGLRDLKIVYRAVRSLKHPARPTNKKKPSVTPATWKAIDFLLRVFWSSSFYFGCATIVACFVYRRIAVGTPGYAYTDQVSYYAVVFCIEVVQVVGPYRFPLSSGDTLKSAILTLSMFLSTFIAGCVLTINVLPLHRSSDPRDLEYPCLPDDVLANMGSYGTLSLMLPLFVVFFVLTCGLMLESNKFAMMIQPTNVLSICRLSLAVSGLAGAWVSITALTQTRQTMAELAGDSFPDRVWGFGQIAAVMGWLPMFFAILRVWWWELLFRGKAPFSATRPSPPPCILFL